MNKMFLDHQMSYKACVYFRFFCTHRCDRIEDEKMLVSEIMATGGEPSGKWGAVRWRIHRPKHGFGRGS